MGLVKWGRPASPSKPPGSGRWGEHMGEEAEGGCARYPPVEVSPWLLSDLGPSLGVSFPRNGVKGVPHPGWGADIPVDGL